MDPLGFTQPFGALRSRLYSQFTVLSNFPAYHGILALIYQLLAQRKITPSNNDFAQRFRQAESLWGMANVATEQSILNVTKYRAILEGRHSFTLKDIGRGNAIFSSLAYGTLGHYSNPSVAWGFLERGAERLTPLGTRLADAFATRSGRSMRAALEQWLDGKSITRSSLEKLGGVYGIDKLPSPAEKKAWLDALDEWYLRAPVTKELWTTPPDENDFKALQADAAAYQNFFPTMAARYPSLAKVFMQAGRFETMSALCLFLFEREYLLCHDAGPALPAAGTLENKLATSLIKLAQQYRMPDFNDDTRGLFALLAEASNHAAVANIILNHHVGHQNAKNTQPYMENGELRLRDRFNRDEFTSLHEELSCKATTGEQLALLSYRYRRDWHIHRALRYSQYFRGNE